MILVSMTNYWVLIPTFFVAILFAGFRQIYSRTARCLKRIEATSRSPVIQHVNATINGASTIRSCAASQRLSDDFDAYLNHNVSAGFLFFATGRSLAMWLESLCIVFMATTITLFLVFDDRKQLIGHNFNLSHANQNNLLFRKRYAQRKRWTCDNTNILLEFDMSVGNATNRRVGERNDER